MGHRQRKKKTTKRSATAIPAARGRSNPVVTGLICVLLVAIVWIVFGRTLGHEFVNYDDDIYITENPHVLHGLNWADVKWAFMTGHTGYSHPVTWLTHQLDYQLFGAWAGGHHLTSVVIHTVNALLLFFLFWRITRDLWPSAFVAALFAIHPLHVESVAWVAERKDVLSGLFFILTLHAYAGYAAKREAWRYVMALLLFVLGILSKPMLVTLPCVLLLLDYWPLRRMNLPGGKNNTAGGLSIGQLILEKVPFALIAVAWSILTFAIQRSGGIVAEGARLGIALRVGNAIVSYGTYLWNTFWPQDLALFYPYPLVLPAGAVMGFATLLVLVSVLCLARIRSSPYLIVGWLWYLGMLAPVIGLIQVGEQARADRYTYLPQIGLCFLATWGFLELSAKWPRRREILAVAALLIVTGLTAASCIQTSYWQNSETLWHRSLASTSNNHIAENNLGNALLHKQRLEEALPHFRNALAIYPNYAEANNNLGYALANKGNWAEAINFYRAALRTRPGYANAHNNLAVALAETGKTDEAMGHFREALRINPDFADAHCNLASVLLQLGRRDEGVAHLKEALQLKPNDTEIREQLRALGVSR